MKRYYANLLGVWTDITGEGTISHNENPSTYFANNLKYDEHETVADCFKYDYVHVQYRGKDYRIHPSMIQIVSD